MTVPRSDAQKAASMMNGSRSFGPRTEAGKRESRRNGTKHGLAAGPLFPDELGPEVEAEVAMFRGKFRPRDDYEGRLVETAAVAQVKINRLNVVLERRTVANVRNATRDWDEARAAEVNGLTELLASDPAAAVRGLQRRTEGCDRLADLWEELAGALARNGRWDIAEGRRALNLMGRKAAPSHGQDAEVAAFWHHAYALHVHADPAGAAREQSRPVEAVLAGLPTRDRAMALVTEFIAAEIAALEALSEDLWDRFDLPDREAAPERALFDTSDEGRKLHRHLADNERMRRRALAELEKLRAEEAKGLREPAQPSREPDPQPAPAAAQSEPEPRAPRGPAPSFEPPPAPSEPEPDADPTAPTADPAPTWPPRPDLPRPA